MNDFHFNDCGVCTNPNIIERWEGRCHIAVKTAMVSPGRWLGVYDIILNNGGSGTPCIKGTNWCHVYPTEKEAVQCALKDAIWYLNRHKTASSPSEADKKINQYSDRFMSAVRNIACPEPVQLSLF